MTADRSPGSRAASTFFANSGFWLRTFLNGMDGCDLRGARRVANVDKAGARNPVVKKLMVAIPKRPNQTYACAGNAKQGGDKA